ncbi:hypothetical protein [Streptomyces uncialis]|uniref:hypothetical protein n=1 Tax=Streptomyces uncialis TaxID=1048205 RepID=UPI00386D34BA|nr:hypothetical protein OG924_32855 [Streptomyces uncialis]
MNSRFGAWAKAGVFQTLMEALIVEEATRGQVGLKLVSVAGEILAALEGPHGADLGAGGDRGGEGLVRRLVRRQQHCTRSPRNTCPTSFRRPSLPTSMTAPSILLS